MEAEWIEGALTDQETEKTTGGLAIKERRYRTVVVPTGYLSLRKEPVFDMNNELGQLHTGDAFAPEWYTVGEDGKGYAYGYSKRYALYGYVLSDYLE